MKQFKLLSMLLAILMVPMMVSCGGDDEKDENLSGDDLIIKASGTWMCTQSVDAVNGQSIQGLMVGKEITINPNGTYSSTAPTFGYTGTYSVSGNKITARSDAGTFLINVSISGDRMTWDGTANSGVSFRYVFERESNTIITQKEFTAELIAGNFQWKVKSVSIKRGSSNQIQAGATISFKEDGTCEGFSSMENAWRLNNGKVETYYKQTGEPMYVYTLLSEEDKDIKVRIAGTLDDNLQAEVVLEKELIPDNVSTEDSFNSREQILAIYNTCYSYCRDFEIAQLKLEGIRRNPATVHQITANSNEVSTAWQKAYQTINVINIVLAKEDALLTAMGNQDGKAMIAELRALRAFVDYNLAMLWGRVPLVNNVLGDFDYNIAQSSQSEVFQFAYNEINAVLDDLRQVNEMENGKARFNKDAGRMLKAELSMALGNKSEAATTLNQIESSLYSIQTRASVSLGGTFIWALPLELGGERPVYHLVHRDLFLYEIAGNKEGLSLPSIDINGDGVPDEDILSYWQFSDDLSYGYWAALKRMGKAQEVTGCSSHELLMPIPSSDFMSIPSLTQNSGY